MKTKNQLIQFLTDHISDCGKNNYFGFTLTDDQFKKEINKMKKREVIELMNRYSDGTQNYLNN